MATRETLRRWLRRVTDKTLRASGADYYYRFVITDWWVSGKGLRVAYCLCDKDCERQITIPMDRSQAESFMRECVP